MNVFASTVVSVGDEIAEVLTNESRKYHIFITEIDIKNNREIAEHDGGKQRHKSAIFCGFYEQDS